VKTKVVRINYLLFHPIALIFMAWFAAILSRLIKNGDVYGLNYNLFQPDGALYHAYTLHLMGNSWSDSARLVNQFFEDQIGKTYLGASIDPIVQRVIFTRPLLSILSVPSVFLLGQVGMLIIPALSFLVIGVVLYLVGKKSGTPYLGVLLYTILTLSTSVNRWMFSDLTDSLLVALIALMYLVIIYSKTKFLLPLLVTLALLTRPSGPLILALLLPFMLTYRKASMFIGVALSILGTIVLAIFSPEAAGTQTTGPYTVYQRIQDFALHGIKVLVVEFGQLLVMDRILFVFVILATVSALFSWKSTFSQSYLGLLIACFAVGAWNGALGVNFRYQLPSIIGGAVVIIFSANDLKGRISRQLKILYQN